jgi:two-component system osmolarity sensor histidine kinase EnvZ
MDYAKPGEVQLKPVHLATLIEREMAGFRDPAQIRITAKLSPDTRVLADEVELGRVFANLFENARRYGKSADTGIARVEVSYSRSGNAVTIRVRDHGPGVPPQKLSQLTTPFYRGDTARTEASGAGLGLAIVERNISRMGGQFEVSNAPDGGFVAAVKLRRAPPASI